MAAVLDILSYVGWVLLAIMILVFVHELGHFLMAKLFGMRVERFSVGFPPRVFGKKIGDTDYMLGLTPLGGYVKISGMVDESMDAEFANSEPQPWEFRAKPVWQRIVVIVAGVVFNMVLAAVVFIGIKAAVGEAYVPNVGALLVDEGSIAHEMGLRTGDELLMINGEPVNEIAGLATIEGALLANPLRLSVRRTADTLSFVGPSDMVTRLNRAEGAFGIGFDPPLVGTVSAGSAAGSLGLEAGDMIVQIGDSSVVYWQDITNALGAADGSPIPYRWVRPDSNQTVPANAAEIRKLNGGTLYEQVASPTQEGDRYMLGVSRYVRFQEYSLLEAIPAGIAETWLNTRVIVTSLKRVFTGQESFRENVGGPIMIAKVTKEAADAGASVFWRIVAMLSITLAVINILPIPALDGGHLVFLIYEGILRREPSFKVRMIMQQVGMVLLLAFMTFVIFNDILKL